MSTSGFSLARRLKAGETVYSGWCGLASPIVAELVGREGFPAVTLDGQHGLWDTASVVTAVAMIETRTALDNVEAIAATPGIDALFLGPADLSIALSNGADVDPMAAVVDRELDRITAAATKAGKIMGAYCHNAERAVALAKRGVRFLAVGSDMGFLRAGAAAALKALKG